MDLEPLVVAVRAPAAVVDRAERAVREAEREHGRVDVAEDGGVRIHERGGEHGDVRDLGVEDEPREVEVVARRVEEEPARERQIRGRGRLRIADEMRRSHGAPISPERTRSPTARKLGSKRRL